MNSKLQKDISSAIATELSHIKKSFMQVRGPSPPLNITPLKYASFFSLTAYVAS